MQLDCLQHLIYHWNYCFNTGQQCHLAKLRRNEYCHDNIRGNLCLGSAQPNPKQALHVLRLKQDLNRSVFNDTWRCRKGWLHAHDPIRNLHDHLERSLWRHHSRPMQHDCLQHLINRWNYCFNTGQQCHLAKLRGNEYCHDNIRGNLCLGSAQPNPNQALHVLRLKQDLNRSVFNDTWRCRKG
jgi:hypothetical protein